MTEYDVSVAGRWNFDFDEQKTPVNFYLIWVEIECDVMYGISFLATVFMTHFVKVSIFLMTSHLLLSAFIETLSLHFP